MDEDDSATILESSLFYSCMSSATAFDGGQGEEKDDDAIASAVDDTNEESGSGNDSIRSISLTSQDEENENNNKKSGSTDDARTTKPKPPSTAADKDENKNNDVASNSSWSAPSERERPKVRSIAFNRDRTCLIVCTSAGVRIRTLESLHLSLQNLNVDDDNNNNTAANNQSSSWIHDVPLPPDGATYAQLLHSTSLLAVVQPSSPRCCFLYNAKNASSPLAALPLSAAVKRVELQRRVLVAMTVDLRLHVFHMTDGGGDVEEETSAGSSNEDTEKKTLRPTLIVTLNIMHPSDSPRNVTRGIDGFNAGSYFDLSTNEDEPYLVCKSFNGAPGTVRVYNPTMVHNIANVSSFASCNTSIGSGSARSTASSWDKYHSPPLTKKVKRRIRLLSTINAHDHSVTRMLIGGGRRDQQTFLATVSSKGTTIRVFGLPTGDHLWEWHRGQRACQIYSLSWNGSADRLASFGSSGTIHIFDWQKKKQPADMTEISEGDNADDEYEGFEKVHDDSQPRGLGKVTKSKPLLRRIGSSIKRRASGSNNANAIKHRSMVKLRYKPSALPDTSVSANSTARTQSLVLALLDRNHTEDRKNDFMAKEDTLVLCSMEGELRQYSVKNDSIGVIQIEDILDRRQG